MKSNFLHEYCCPVAVSEPLIILAVSGFEPTKLPPQACLLTEGLTPGLSSRFINLIRLMHPWVRWFEPSRFMKQGEAYVEILKYE